MLHPPPLSIPVLLATSVKPTVSSSSSSSSSSYSYPYVEVKDRLTTDVDTSLGVVKGREEKKEQAKKQPKSHRKSKTSPALRVTAAQRYKHLPTAPAFEEGPADLEHIDESA